MKLWRVKGKHKADQQLSNLSENPQAKKKNYQTIALSAAENIRLSELLRAAPGPTPWDAIYYPKMAGPNGSELVWDKNGLLTTLVSIEKCDSGLGNANLGRTGYQDPHVMSPRTMYLALGLYCYVRASSSDRLLEWHTVTRKVGKGKGDIPISLEINLINTCDLKEIFESVLNEKAPKQPGPEGSRSTNGIIVEGGVIETINLPTSLEVGENKFHFPSAMRSEEEILILADSTIGVKYGEMDPSGTLRVLYVVDPAHDKVNVVLLDWWNMGNHDFGYEWISKIVRDPVTENIVGGGVRIFPFILDSRTYKFLGFWHPP
jgi:hypothetical protein